MSILNVTNDERVRVLVDDDLYPILSSVNWQIAHGYIRRSKCENGKQTNQILARYVYELKYGDIAPGLEIDHINGNKLDNRIANLRAVTHSQNNANRSKANHGRYEEPCSKYKGVTVRTQKWKRKDGTVEEMTRYKAQIKDPDTGRMIQRVFPYTSNGEIQAARWYDCQALKRYGYYANINFPERAQAYVQRDILKKINVVDANGQPIPFIVDVNELDKIILKIESERDFSERSCLD